VEATDNAASANDSSLSPDGRQVAFSWNGESGRRHIYVALSGEERPLRLTQDPADDGFPAWSPDGKQLLFCAAGRNPNSTSCSFPQSAVRNEFCTKFASGFPLPEPKDCLPGLQTESLFVSRVNLALESPRTVSDVPRFEKRAPYFRASHQSRR